MLAWLAQHWGWVLAGVAVFVLGVWAYQEYEEDKSAADIGKGVGSKARRASGGFVGFAVMLTIGVLGGMWDAGMELSEFGVFLGDLFASAPQLFAGIGAAVLGALGLSGVVQLGPYWYLGIAMMLLGAGAIVSKRRYRSRRGRWF